MCQNPHSAHEIARSGPGSSSGGVASAAALYRADKALFFLFVAVVWPGFLLFLIPCRWLE